MKTKLGTLLTLLAACGSGGGGAPGGGGSAPAAPSALVAFALSPVALNVSWNDASGDETGFEVERAPAAVGPFTLIVLMGTDQASFDDQGLQPSTTYYYRVRSVKAAGATSQALTSAYSNTASATTQGLATIPPAPPAGAAAVALSSNRIQVSWTDASTDETGFEVERASAAAGPFTQFAQVSANETMLHDQGLQPSTTYYYRVRSVKTVGEPTFLASAYTAIASATTQAPAATPPAAPSGATAVALSTSSIQVSWTDGATDETDFVVERATSPAGPFAQVGVVHAGQTAFDDQGLPASTTYHYRVLAVNAAGSSPPSNTASATTRAPALTPPAAPSGAMAVALSTSRIQVSWTDNSTDETTFAVERATSGAGPYAMVGQLQANGTAFGDQGLQPSTTYYYRVRAASEAGESAYSNIASATTQAPAVTPPAAPSGATAVALSTRWIQVSWTDNSTDETDFVVERATSAGGPFAQVRVVQANQTAFDDQGLPASTTYHYRVRAVNQAGGSAYSNTASGTTHGIVIVPPLPPTAPAAAALGSTSIRVTWTDNSSDETGFRVERATSPTGPFVTAGTVTANASTFDDAGLTPSTTYHYRICTTGADADSVFSATTSATTAAAATPPTGPTMALVSAPFAGVLRVTWIDTSADETGFEVERATVVAGPFARVRTTAADQASFDDEGLAPSTTYHYRVRAVNQAGASPYSNTATGTTQGIVIVLPFPPTAPTATALGSASIRVTWTDNSSDETGFRIERATSPTGPFATAGAVSPNLVTFDDAGLSASTTYYYRICATRSDADSIFTATVSATTQAGGVQTAYFVAVSDNSVRISSFSTDPENSVMQSSPNEVGCLWTLLFDPSGYPLQHMICDAVLLKFDVSSLAGRTIIAAGVNLYAERPAIDRGLYAMNAIAGAWNPASVTFTNMPGTHQASGWMLYTEGVPTWMTWRATEIVQNWASGAWANHGVIVQDAEFAFPYASLLKATRFASREVYADPAHLPVLVVDYE